MNYIRIRIVIRQKNSYNSYYLFFSSYKGKWLFTQGLPCVLEGIKFNMSLIFSLFIPSKDTIS